MLGRVARLHYENGLTHQEIAELFAFSRIKVTRMLAEARRSGIVEITVHTDERPFAEIERALIEKFDLQGAWVSPPLSDESGVDPSVLGITGAEAMKFLLSRAERVAIGLSAAVSTSARLLAPILAPHLKVFPLAGGRAGNTSGSNPQELVATVARATSGQGFQLPAPLIAADTRVYESLMHYSGCDEVLREAALSDLLIVGIGSARKVAPVFKQQINDADLKEISGSPAVGDISARFFDIWGLPVSSEVDNRVISLSLAQMRRIRHRLAIAGGQEKVEAVRASVSSGLVNFLATDLKCAEGLLASEG